MEISGRSARAFVIALLLVGAPACHEEGDAQVSAVTFDGNNAFPDGRLRDVIVVRASGKLPWSKKYTASR